MATTLGLLRKLITETLEDELEDKIEALRGEPEFASVEAFITDRLDSEVYQYNFMELHALGRNITAAGMGKKERRLVAAASRAALDRVKRELGELGFQFVGRAVPKTTRGFTSSSHGTHPFAGGGGGGSGFGSDYSGATFTSYGGGPGAVGGGYRWDPDDPKNLRMGAGRKK